MEKAIFSCLAIWILVNTAFFGMLILIPEEEMRVSAITITVDDDASADHSTIQAAIDLSTAGDTIIVRSGTYHENVVIDKELTLNGDGMTTTTIDGGGNGDVIIITSNSVDINGFRVTNGGDDGIELSDVSNCKISCCDISDNEEIGICLEASYNNNVNSNKVSNNGDDGIYLSECESNIINNNTCISNGDDGIYLDGSNSNTITNNTSNLNSDDGIEVAGDTNTIVNNICTNNEDGIKLEESTNNIIRENTVSSNTEIGINLESSSSNKIYHNSIIDNAVQAYDDGANVWSYQKEGNYWSDYNGKDGNDDHIGDAPYVIDDNSQDKYPLMEPYNPNLSIEAEEPSTMPWILFLVLAIIIVCIIVLVLVLRKRAVSAEGLPKFEEQSSPVLSDTERLEWGGEASTLTNLPQDTFQVTCSICNNLIQVNDIGVTMNVTCPFCSGLLTIKSRKAATQPPQQQYQPAQPEASTYNCPHCGNPFTVQPSTQAQIVSCPSCSGHVSINPLQPQTPAPLPLPPPALLQAKQSTQKQPTQTQPDQPSGQPETEEESAMDILNMRLAKGEIDLETYQELKKEIE